jgi:hypothetical protein
VPEQRRDLGARLDEAEDVVDEQKHVLATLLSVIFGHRQARQGDAETGSGRLVHLTEDEHRFRDDAALFHLEPEVVALSRALADADEGGQPLVLLGDVPDELLDQDGLADSGTTEQPDLAAFGVRGEQIDDLDPGLQDLLGRGQVRRLRRGPVDRPTLDVVGQRLTVVDRVAEQVEDAAQGHVADRDGDRTAGVADHVAALDAVGGVHRDRADAIVTEVLLDLADEPGVFTLVVPAALDHDRRVDLGQPVGEERVDHHSGDLLDAPDLVLSVAVAVLSQFDLGPFPGLRNLRLDWVV